ncbi:mycofactocin-associated electron transfer flavoprotein alpha subunit [Micromonospora sp. CPCC 205711]|uniref:mycofactocin-associated electron transfer flavoprotein alpha subunit n=1 Tax=Micromonospora sp. CPCC 205547 TaxID=3122400 RepID=UPI002FF045BA
MTPEVGAPIAVVVARAGRLPLGAAEAAAEAGGRALVIGSGAAEAAGALAGAHTVHWTEQDGFRPGHWSAQLATVLAGSGPILLPASPDGRDLAPRLAAVLRRPLLAGATRLLPDGAEVLRWGGRLGVELAVDGPFVATLQPGVRGVDADHGAGCLHPLTLPPPPATPEVTTVSVADPEPATVALAEAPRILTAGAGIGRGELTGPQAVALLGRVAAGLGASLGATRVVTDAGWVPAARQIGTTGVLVDPDLCVAFGVSGAAQHLGGLGQPRHLVSVNPDASCPMTTAADLALVTDAAALLAELAARLDPGVRPGAKEHDD